VVSLASEVFTSELYTSENENRFFTKSKYEFIGHDFKLEALEELTNDPKFIKELDYSIGSMYIRKFRYKEGEKHFFFDFYLTDYDKERFTLIHAYHNKEDYFSIDTINHNFFYDLELNVKITNKRVKKGS